VTPRPERPAFDLEAWLRSPGRRVLLFGSLVLVAAGLSTLQRAEVFDARGIEVDAFGVFVRQVAWWGSWALGAPLLVRLAVWTWTRWRSVTLFVVTQLALSAASAWAFEALHRTIDDTFVPDFERRPELDGLDRPRERRGRFGSGGRRGPFGPRERVRAFRLQREILVYWVVIGIGLGVRSYLAGRDEARRRAEVELHAERLRAELARAELQSLRSELNPHFLFNALHAVGGLVRAGDTTTALETLSSIADLLRTTLDRTETQEVSLREDLAIAERFLALERLRFGERLTTRIELPPELESCRVPSLVLLPLVENAVRYAVEPRTEGGHVEIEARREGDQCVIEVRDDGPGFPPHVLAPTGPPVTGPDERRGIGLANTRARVAMLYGTDAGLELANRPRGGAVVRVRVPAR